MRQVFLNAPWVHDAEPPQLKAIFEQHGVLRKFPKGFIFNHGGTQGNVYFITKGLVFFTFPDPKDKFRVFGILPPDRVVGDLDASASMCSRPAPGRQSVWWFRGGFTGRRSRRIRNS